MPFKTQSIFKMHVKCLIILFFYCLFVKETNAANSTKVKPQESTIVGDNPVHDVHWAYKKSGKLVGMRQWASVYKDCGGKRQSPINLDFSKVVRNPNLDLQFSGYYSKLTHCYVENNGHTVNLGCTDKVRPYITGSVVKNDVYEFKMLHVHWGMKNGIGSEHQYNGKTINLEMHLVHFNRKYGSLDKAQKEPDGLAVLGVFYKLSKKKNKYLIPILKYASKVPIYKDRLSIQDTIILRNLLPGKVKPFFTYLGSLTTPPCYESVTWIVFKDMHTISNSQEEWFRRERGEHVDPKTGKYKVIGNNYREPQPLNNRKIVISGN